MQLEATLIFFMDNDSFFEQVYQVVCLVPEGRVTTYGAIANYLTAPMAARMVGWAMNKSFSKPYFIPAHRVVNRNGCLTGKHHFPSPTMMEKMLKKEGVMIKNTCIVNFEAHFWNPIEEL